MSQPSPAQPSRPPRSRLARFLYGLLAYTSLGIGLVAIVVPGLPTTEFILLAAWAATRSSPRLSAWLDNHKLFGPILDNWRHGKVITRRAKLSATASMVLCSVIMALTLKQHWPVYAAIAGMVLVNLWIWSRPEQRRAEPSSTGSGLPLPPCNGSTTMFEPGRLSLVHNAVTAQELSYRLFIHYETHGHDQPVDFTVSGEIGQQTLEEQRFQLAPDLAYNFAHDVNRIVRAHGLNDLDLAGSGSRHHDYDLMFEDLRSQLGTHSGDAVKPQHLE